MALSGYPALDSLRADLQRLEATEGVREALRAGRGRGVSFGRGRDVCPVRVPWVRDQEWLLTAPQRRVVALLVEALASRVKDVPEAVLRREAGFTGKLAELFAGSGAWGVLVVPGRPGHYQLPEPPPGWDEGDDEAR